MVFNAMASSAEGSLSFLAANGDILARVHLAIFPASFAARIVVLSSASCLRALTKSNSDVPLAVRLMFPRFAP